MRFGSIEESPYATCLMNAGMVAMEVEDLVRVRAFAVYACS
ncbi:hypothetical protein [Acinetobacter baumannii]